LRYKQVIIVRTDIKMSKGKIAVQVAHAAVTATDIARKEFVDWFKAWIREGQCKVALKVDSEDDLLALKEKAKTLKLPHALIVDRGLTEIPPGTTTCLGIGPAPLEVIDKLTGSLPLL
jgi:PTH2 family peptidyl-tRNA hydrolase